MRAGPFSGRREHYAEPATFSIASMLITVSAAISLNRGREHDHYLGVSFPRFTCELEDIMLKRREWPPEGAGEPDRPVLDEHRDRVRGADSFFLQAARSSRRFFQQLANQLARP